MLNVCVTAWYVSPSYISSMCAIFTTMIVKCVQITTQMSDNHHITLESNIKVKYTKNLSYDSYCGLFSHIEWWVFIFCTMIAYSMLMTTTNISDHHYDIGVKVNYAKSLLWIIMNASLLFFARGF